MLRSVVVAVCCLLLAPAAARADFSVTSFDIAPSGLQAGSHPDGAFTGRLRKHRTFRLETLDAAGHIERQCVTPRR